MKQEGDLNNFQGRPLQRRGPPCCVWDPGQTAKSTFFHRCARKEVTLSTLQTAPDLFYILQPEPVVHHLSLQREGHPDLGPQDSHPDGNKEDLTQAGPRPDPGWTPQQAAPGLTTAPITGWAHSQTSAQAGAATSEVTFCRASCKPLRAPGCGSHFCGPPVCGQHLFFLKTSLVHTHTTPLRD